MSKGLHIPNVTPAIPRLHKEDLMAFVYEMRGRPQNVVESYKVLYLNVEGNLIRIGYCTDYVFKKAERLNETDDIRVLYIFEPIAGEQNEKLNMYLSAYFDYYNFIITRNDVDAARIVELRLTSVFLNSLNKLVGDCLDWPTEEEADRFMDRLKEDRQFI